MPGDGSTRGWGYRMVRTPGGGTRGLQIQGDEGARGCDFGGCGCRGDTVAKGMRVPGRCGTRGTWVPGGCRYQGCGLLGDVDTRGFGHRVPQRCWVGVCASPCPQSRRGPSWDILEAVPGVLSPHYRGPSLVGGGMVAVAPLPGCWLLSGTWGEMTSWPY